MAYYGTGLLTPEDGGNYLSFNPRKPNEGKYPDPSEMILGSDHIFVVDSRTRNKDKFPTPSKYSVKLPEVYKNVTSIELKGSLLPKTERNVNSDNCYIPFNVVDSVTNARILDGGFGYIDGVYGFGTANPTLATITPPAIAGGTNATITVTVVDNSIASVIIPPGEEGSGYLRGYYGGVIEDPTNGFYQNAKAAFINRIPRDNDLRDRFRDANVEITVGQELIAKMNVGMYDFTNPNDSDVGLAAEVTRALQEAVQDAIDDGVLIPQVGGPTSGAEYFPTGAPDTGSTYLTTSNPNASGNDRVVIQRGEDDGSYTQSPFLELLFGSTELKTSAQGLLGYGSTSGTITAGTYFPPVDQTSGSFTFGGGGWSATPIIARNDYNLCDSPKYVILEIKGLSNTRMDSESEEIAKGYCILAFDANMPNAIFRSPNVSGPGTGDSDYASLLAKPGILKGIKGQDFDSKYLSFGNRPDGKMSHLQFEFKTFGGNYYDFQGREHTLIFQLGANDINSGNRF